MENRSIRFQFKFDVDGDIMVLKPLTKVNLVHYLYDLKQPMLFHAKNRVVPLKCGSYLIKPTFDFGDLQLKSPRPRRPRPAFVPRSKRWQSKPTDDNPVLEGRESIPKPPKHDVQHALADTWQKLGGESETGRQERLVTRSMFTQPLLWEPVHPMMYWVVDCGRLTGDECAEHQDRVLKMRVKHIWRLIERTTVKDFGLDLRFEPKDSYWGAVTFSVRLGEVVYRDEPNPDPFSAMQPGRRGPLYFNGNKVSIHASDREVLKALRTAAAKLLLHELDECFFDDKGVRVFDPHDRKRWLPDEIKPIPV